MTEDTDLGEGAVSDDRQDQLAETLEYQRWKRRFGKWLAGSVLIGAGVMLIGLLVYVFCFEHRLADISAIAALAGVPTALLIGLMRYFLPRNGGTSESGNSESPPDSYQFAWTIAHALRSMATGHSGSQ